MIYNGTDNVLPETPTLILSIFERFSFGILYYSYMQQAYIRICQTYVHKKVFLSSACNAFQVVVEARVESDGCLRINTTMRWIRQWMAGTEAT